MKSQLFIVSNTQRNSPASSTRRRWLSVLALSALCLATPPSQAADGNWGVDADGSWSTPANWVGNIVADGAGSTAYFTNALTTIRTVTLDSARTNGNLVFGNASADTTTGGWIFSGSGLTLTNSAATPVITVSNMNAVLGAQDSTNDVLINSIITSSQGFIKNGAGTLTLAGANVLGSSAQLNEGIVTIGNAAALGSGNRPVNFNGGGIRVRGGGPAYANTNNVLTTASVISSNGNYDALSSVWVGSGTVLIHAAGRLSPGNGNNSTFASFTGTIDLTDSPANEVRINLGSGNPAYDLSKVTLNLGTNAGRVDFRTTVAPATVRIGALLGGPNTRLDSSEQGGGTSLFWEIGNLNTSTLFEGVIRNRNGLAERVGHLVKVGTGKLTLSGNNIYTGGTTVSSGVLALIDSGALSGTTNVITVASGARFDVSGLTNAPFTLSASQSLQGNGVVTGNVAMVAGTIRPGTSIGTLSFSNNLSLASPGGTTTNLFEITGPGNSDLIIVAGDLTLSDIVAIRCIPTGGSIPNGTYTLIRYGGTLAGNLSNLQLEYPAQLGTLALGINTGTKEIYLQVSGVPGAANLTWRGDGSGNAWDATTANWRDGGGTAVLFNNGDNLTFNNSGSNNVPVNIAIDVNPSTTTVNASQNYVFASTGGKITGTGSLLKTNSGTLTLALDNDYTGSTVVAGGTLQIGDGAVSAGSPGTGALTNNARVVLNRPDDITFGAAIHGTGVVVKVSTDTVTLGAASTFSGGTTISNGTLLVSSVSALGSGAVTLAGGTLSAGGLALANGLSVVADSTVNNASGETQYTSDSLNGAAGATLILSGGTIRFTGSGFTLNCNVAIDLTALQSYNQFGNQTFNGVISGAGIYRRRWPVSDLANTGTTIMNGANTYSGGTLLREGSIGFGISSVATTPPTIDSGPVGTGPLTQDGGTIYTAVFASGGARAVENPIVLNLTGAPFTIKGGFNLTLSGTVDLGGGTKDIQVENTAKSILTGDIANGTLNKTGPGALYINGNNNASATTVAAGTLAGSGIFNGPVTVQSDATLAPGASVGTMTINSDLTLAGNLAIEVNKTLSPSNDIVAVIGVLTNAGTGTLTVNNLGPALVAGDKFILLSQPLQNGGALTVTGGGTGWINNLALDGSITAAALTPPTLSVTNNGASLSFSWTGSFKLQAQTNNINVGLSGNWGDYPGGSVSPVNVTINPANPTVFFRLSSQ